MLHCAKWNPPFTDLIKFTSANACMQAVRVCNIISSSLLASLMVYLQATAVGFQNCAIILYYFLVLSA